MTEILTDMASKLIAELNCLKCKNQLEEPKIFPCFHTICKSCVDDLVDENGEFDGEGNVTFNCPKDDCDKTCVIKHDETSVDVATNEPLKNILSIVCEGTNTSRLVFIVFHQTRYKLIPLDTIETKRYRYKSKVFSGL